eukprot:c17735_g1_i1.p1 GENE.c17735_g1_i1~~c17735_g1_i1.p1  ORF type:complete len:218 (+),score=57.46 c17735_g1_i1:42-695(+)
MHKPSRLLTLQSVNRDPIPRNLTLLQSTAQDYDMRQFDLPQDFFEVTQQDVQSALSMAERERKREEQSAMLKTKAMRDSEEIERVMRYSKCLIRISLPNRIFIQAEFNPFEPVRALYDLVDSCIVQPLPEYYLYVTPPVQRLDDVKDEPLYKIKLVPTAVVLLKHLGGELILDPDLASEILPVSRGAPIPIPIAPPSSQSTSKSSDSVSKKPKWFKG